jgi:hypothetical protein
LRWQKHFSRFLLDFIQTFCKVSYQTFYFYIKIILSHEIRLTVIDIIIDIINIYFMLDLLFLICILWTILIIRFIRRSVDWFTKWVGLLRTNFFQLQIVNTDISRKQLINLSIWGTTTVWVVVIWFLLMWRITLTSWICLKKDILNLIWWSISWILLCHFAWSRC